MRKTLLIGSIVAAVFAAVMFAITWNSSPLPSEQHTRPPFADQAPKESVTMNVEAIRGDKQHWIDFLPVNVTVHLLDAGGTELFIFNVNTGNYDQGPIKLSGKTVFGYSLHYGADAVSARFDVEADPASSYVSEAGDLIWCSIHGMAQVIPSPTDQWCPCLISSNEGRAVAAGAPLRVTCTSQLAHNAPVHN